MGRHLLYIPEALPPVLGSFFHFWARIGWVGVDLFFVLSGFLVSGLLFAEQRKSGTARIGRFLIRRAFKIYPPFYVFLLVSLLTSWFFHLPAPPGSRQFVAEALFLQNYFAPIWNHTWSLAIEEHFYLLLALLIDVMRWRGRGDANPFRRLPIIAGIVGCAILMLRIVKVYSLPGDTNTWPDGAFFFPWDADSLPLNAWQTIAFPSHFRIDSLFFGVLLAYFYHFHRDALTRQVNRFASLLFLIASLAFLLPALCDLEHSRFMTSIGYTLIYIACGAMVLLATLFRFKLKEQLLRLLVIPAQVGERSYSIYLWHMMIYHVTFRFCTPATPAAFYLQTILYLSGSLLVGTLSAKLIEFPMLTVRNRYFPTGQRQVEVPH